MTISVAPHAPSRFHRQQGQHHRMQAGLMLPGEGSQPLRRGGVETRFETVVSRFRGEGAREIQRPFVKGLSPAGRAEGRANSGHRRRRPVPAR